MNMDTICKWFGVSRQAHYQKLRRERKAREEEQKVLDKVHAIRQRHPKMGTRKLVHELGPELKQEGIFLGRDQFFDLLRRHDLLIKPARRKRRTTWPGLWRCPNLLKDLDIEQVQQVWVADITYLETERGFCYLSLVTDAYSRYIVGYDLSTSLSVEGALRALEMAIKQAPTRLDGLIHHSDHGVQYTCHAYRDLLSSVGIRSSMGEVGNCYENALAERMNGILKLEYGLNNLFLDPAQAEQAVCEAVYLYNFERPHLSLDYQTPAAIHATQTAAYTVFSDSFVNAI